MECLHGEPASSSRTTNGLFFYCGQKPSCNFFCPQNDCSFFQNAIVMWRNSNSPQPRCHKHKKLAKMRVVKDIFKLSFGRPFFVCSDKEKSCSFWQWGDEIRPQCYHDVQCSTRKVKKEGANKGHLFYACPMGKDESCGYFEWRDTEKREEDDDPLEPFCITYFGSTPSFRYTVKKTDETFISYHEDHKQAYAEYLSSKNGKECDLFQNELC